MLGSISKLLRRAQSQQGSSTATLPDYAGLGGAASLAALPADAFRHSPIIQQPLGLGQMNLQPGTLRGDMMNAVLGGWLNQPQISRPQLPSSGQSSGTMQFPEWGGIPPWMSL